MSKFLLFSIFLYTTTITCYENQKSLILLAKKRSGFLENFRSYSDVAVSQIEIPKQTDFVSFKISAEPFDLSIFGCSLEKVEVYVKKGSIPVLNPDNSHNPQWAKNITRSPLYDLHIWTDKIFNYVNITTPEPGIYYFLAYFPYVDPNKVVVKQKGLSQQCTGFINILAYISKANVKMLTEKYTYPVRSDAKKSYYGFKVKPNVREIIFEFKNVTTSYNSNVTLRLSQNSLPSKKSPANEIKTINLKDKELESSVWFNRDGDYFLEFEFDDDQCFFEFSFKFVSSNQSERFNLKPQTQLDLGLFKTGSVDYFYDQTDDKLNSYILYDLVKESGSESFLYTFNIKHEKDNEFMVPIPLNLTSNDFSVMKFQIDDIIDVGGTFEFSIDFRGKYRDDKFNSGNIDQIIIGCLSQNVYEVPTLPRHCMRNGVKSLAPVVINNTVDNSTVLIPYPEAGIWYATFKLFCRPCKNCECYRECSELLQQCMDACQCHSLTTCTKCSTVCKEKLREHSKCQHCNCDGECDDSMMSCNSTIMFDLSSFPCIMGKCGRNGKCQYMLADGYIYSACRCWNKYRGMDCTDDSNADPFWKIIVAQILLISSNLIMVPCVYFAWKRRYFSESVMYASVLFFSSFYHACDVSDYKVQFCISTHSSLQFGDFFSALLSIWATMLAISDLNIKLRSILHVIGAIILAYFTVIDRTGIWIFLMIAVPGIVSIGISWYMKYRKFGKEFVKVEYVKYYFSSGIIVMALGVSIYAFLQTSGNYMYLHSIWHCIVGTTVIIILPRPHTFPKIFPDIVD